LADAINPDKARAQIILEIEAKGKALEMALSVLRSLGSVEFFMIRDTAPFIILFYVSSDVREAVVKLTEAGFTKIKGISPLKNISKQSEKKASVPINFSK